MPELPAIDLKAGQKLNGFTVEDVTVLDSLYMVAYRLVHDKTGAKIINLNCEDEECLFSINFPTPPEDDTGLPHIMEHAVLSGSKQFPVRDPFFEMVKMSMATFINAMTGPDCTYYPACSNVKKDFFNLATVYFDAVFHPLLTPSTFKREGHHLVPADPENPNAELNVNGIVYNEMKAAFSRPESRLGRISFRQLFPGSCYGFESGGDPVAIPDLTYEDFLNFHRKFYHPSNAHFVFYGNIPTEEYLDFLESRLEDFEKQPVEIEFGKPASWSFPKVINETYDIGNEPPEEKTFLEINWLIKLDMDLEITTLMEILSHLLLGDDAAPLKKAIIDSGLGADLTSSGFRQIGTDGMFCVGIRGSEECRFKTFIQLVKDELERVAEKGLDEKLVESAFRRYSLTLREVRALPGLGFASRVLASWIQNKDPLMLLNLQNVLEKVREDYHRNPSIFTRLINEKLLDNPHRLDVCMAPDSEWKKRNDAKFAKRMAGIRKRLSHDNMLELCREAKELQIEAGTPNSPEALASLPQLQHIDLPEKPVFIPTTQEKLSTGNTFLRNDVFSNGINYLHIYIDMEALDPELHLALPRFIETLSRLGAAGQNYIEIARRKSADTGGLAFSTTYNEHYMDESKNCKGICIYLKALDEQMPDALNVLYDCLFEADPNDKNRFKDVLTQGLSRIQTGLVNNGPTTPIMQLRAGLTEIGYLQEMNSGLSQYREVKRLHDSYENTFSEILDQVKRISDFIRNRNRFTFSFTGSDKAAKQTKKALESWLGNMKDDSIEKTITGFKPFSGIPRLGFAGPMQVAHCSQILPALHSSHPDSTILDLAMAMLRVDYMVSELRFKGNAYGASCSYNGRDITLSTYADPHVKRTLDVFEGLSEYVKNVPWTTVEVTRGILSTAKYAIMPIRPASANYSALNSYITGKTDDLRRKQYEILRNATAEQVKSVLIEVLDKGFQKAPVAVLSNLEKLEKANSEMGEKPLEISELLDSSLI